MFLILTLYEEGSIISCPKELYAALLKKNLRSFDLIYRDPSAKVELLWKVLSAYTQRLASRSLATVQD